MESPKKGQRVELQAKRVEILGPCNLEVTEINMDSDCGFVDPSSGKIRVY